MAKRAKNVYERVFFDRLLGTGVVFLAIAYITRETWAGPFAEAVALMVGIVWAYRAITTNSHVVLRLLAALMLVLIGSLLAIYMGKINGLL